MSEPPGDPNEQTHRVHLRNLSPTSTAEELERWCRDLGVEATLYLARDPRSGRHAGEAYIVTLDVESAEAVVAALNGQRIGGATIEAVRIEGDSFFDQDGLFADGEAPMGRQDGQAPRRASSPAPERKDDEP